MLQSLKEYVPALGWWGWFVMMGVVASIVGLILDVTGWSNLPPWVWIILGFSALAIAPFFAFHRLRDDRDTKIAALKSIPSLLCVEQDERWWQPAPGGPVLGRYLAIKCDNKSDRDIQNCRVRLETLERWVSESSVWICPETFSPLTLSWSLNDGGGATQTIGARSNRSCDLVCYESQDATEAIILAAEDRLRGANRIGFGKWRATCQVQADAFLPLAIQATFVWEPEDTQVGQLRELEFTELRVVGAEG